MPALEALWPSVTTPFHVTTDPPGASVSYQPYHAASPPESSADGGSDVGSPTGDASDSESGSAGAQWRALGQTPYRRGSLPRPRLPLPDREGRLQAGRIARSLLTGERIEFFAKQNPRDFLADPGYALDLELSPAGSLPAGHARGRRRPRPAAAHPRHDVSLPREVPAFLIDRTEVTNHAYREFVAPAPTPTRNTGASHSSATERPYQPPKPWRRSAIPPAARDLRLGSGGAPHRSESLPVSGVSWFEAAAYCRWRGGRYRPSITGRARQYRARKSGCLSRRSWSRGPTSEGSARSRSRAFPPSASPGPTTPRQCSRVGSRRPAAGAICGRRGSDPVDFVNLMNATTPWDRSPSNGFRCAKYPEGDPPAPLRE